MTDAGFIPEIEAQVLGAILLGGAHPIIFATLEERHFVEPVHREIYRAALAARDGYNSTRVDVVGKLIDPTVASQFKTASGVDIGAYMASCTSSSLYSAANERQGVKNVIAQWARLTVAKELELHRQAASSADADVLAIVRAVGEMIDEVSANLRRGSRGKTRMSFAEAGREMVEAVREARAHSGLTGIPTGLADLDRLTGGVQRKDLALLGARPSMGKTSIATSMAASAAFAGNGIGVLSLEMDTRKLMTRVASDLLHRSGIHVPYEDLINGRVQDSDIEAVEHAVERARTLPLFIDDQSGLSISDIRFKVEGLAADAEAAGFSLDMLVVDHLLKVRPTSRYAGNRVHEIAEITEGLKELAREYDLAVLLLTQLNRAVESRDDKRPTLADLRDSGAIEQDADTVMFLYREAYYLQREKPLTPNASMDRDAKLAGCLNKAELEVAKQRNGRVQTIELWCDMAYSAFRNAARYGQYAEAA